MNSALISSLRIGGTRTAWKFSQQHPLGVGPSWIASARFCAQPSTRPVVYVTAKTDSRKIPVKSGFGVFWGSESGHNLSRPARGDAYPSQLRTMLEATIAALRQVEADGHKRVTLRTNSKEFANSIRRNLPEWAKNGFTSRGGKPLMHQELFREVSDLVGVTEANIEFDSSSEGIAAAVNLAEAGAEQFTPADGAAWVEAAEKSIAAKGRTSFYAVRHGRVPGVYRTYRELQENIGGYKFAAFKKFDNDDDAWKFVNGEISISKDTGRTATFYAVQVGRKPGVFRSWDECVKQIEGMPNAVFKKFADEKAARDFVEAAATSVNPETQRKKD